MLKITKVLMAFILVFIITNVAVATSPTTIRPVAQEYFHPVLVTPGPSLILEPYRRALPVRSKESTPVAKIKEKPKTSGQSIPRHGILRGRATWYCVPGVSACHKRYNGGLYAAAGSELREALGSRWRGQKVLVCRQNKCVSVRLIDWCACGGPRVIDLYGDAFKRLAPLSSGVINVKIYK
jgi:rare lipoprotein A (peptidoglycan hydrolase)